MTKQTLPEKPLTEVELEMMNVIWRIGPCSINQILEELHSDRDLAYTTVSTMVRILEQKNFVTSTKAGRSHLYQAAIAKGDYQVKSITEVVKNVFDGLPAALIKQLLNSKNITAGDLQDIRNILDGKG